ncbi:extracellular solute-binding protein family 1 [Paenibacillus vortex V453]|uniref:ABC transporter substrate-binding protein n=2 Tax=Paenibacillus TaxID=44249 RepID=A0A163FBR6_9BACL|nr:MULTISPECIES: ABC transporter substrate-binding protein [Paenibacillus]EFU39111.1 extracellular solute-binding protein family 1 [Paenibacillus vortex V453]KZS44277.1 ABC transporter substrate-binding protein [Paenibacillus glucanolyticus]
MLKHARPRRWFMHIVLIMLLTSYTTGCFPQPGHNDEAYDGDTVNLIYYTIGEPDKDLQLVNDKINEIMARKIGVTITYVKVSWLEYEDRLNTLISAGSPFDIAFAPDYATTAMRGAWLKLDDYLTGIGKDMYDAIDPTFWQGVRMNDGSIYGVPTNKELAVRDHWMYPASIVNKHNIDITQYNTLESLEPLLRMIRQEEPAYIPMELDRDSQNFFALHGYEYILNHKLPLMVQSLNPAAQVVNIFETKEARQVLDTLRRYYKEGFINKDAALREPGALKRGAKVFWKSSGGGPLSETTWSKDRGYKLVAHPVTPNTVTTEAVRGGIMAVNANTKHPVECIKFLNLLNTDPEIRNLFNYGIEGVHYTLDEQGQVVLITDKNSNDDAVPDTPASSYSGVQYTQGNWFILKTMGGDNPEPLDKWDQFRKYNDGVVNSTVLGFTPDLSSLTAQTANIEMVWQKYYPSLMTGSVDVDTILPKFNEELKQAGMDEVRQEVQKQLDAWRSQRE